MLSDKTIQCLYRAGWTPERRVDISDWERKLNQLGIVLSPAAHEFMSRYAGLDICVPYYSEILGYEEVDIQIALLDPTFEPRTAYTKETKELTGLSLFMIGESSQLCIAVYVTRWLSI